VSKSIKTKIHKTIILQILLYRCETRPATLSEEHKTVGVTKQVVEGNIWTQ
jgi:hypothetical protein